MDTATHALELAGTLATEPEPITSAAQPLTFVFLETGDGGVPQEVLCDGEAAEAAAELHRGDRVVLGCEQERGLWRARLVKLVPRRGLAIDEEPAGSFA